MSNSHNEAVLPSVQIIGLGYIGLPTAAIMADAGFTVLGVDVVQKVVDTINRGDIHIVEDGLEEMVRKAVSSGHLSASTVPQAADVHIIAVPTPIHEDKSPDVDYVVAATKAIGTVLKKGDLVIVESTIPPLTCEGLVAPQLEQMTGLKTGIEYHLVHCPERVIPGRILHELVYNDRIIGGTTEDATERAATLYGYFVKGDLLKTTATTAEMCKLMENTFRDVNIALANEFAAIAEKLDFDVLKAIELANHHPRVNIHTPSIGVGGHCIPVDPWFIVNAAPGEARLIRSAREINDSKTSIVAGKIASYIDRNPAERVGVLGLTYKPNVDDLRESPAIQIVQILSSRVRQKIFVADPFVKEVPNDLIQHSNIIFSDLETLLHSCDTIALLVEHDGLAHSLQSLNKKVLSIQNRFS